MKKVECLRLGIFQVNCYFLHNGNHILCIDPGANIKKIQQYLEQYPDSVLDGICLTHGHFDHVGAVDELVKLYHCPVYLSGEDEYLARTKKLNFMGARWAIITCPIKEYPIGKFTIGAFSLEVIDTPGHTAGSVCLVWDDCLFSGDTLFKNSVGRTDLYSSNDGQLKQSLEVLKGLHPDMKVYPGHADFTTIHEELLFNPYLR